MQEIHEEEWFKVDSPTIKDWMDIVHKIYIMEKLQSAERNILPEVV